MRHHVAGLVVAVPEARQGLAERQDVAVVPVYIWPNRPVGRHAGRLPSPPAGGVAPADERVLPRHFRRCGAVGWPVPVHGGQQASAA